jgi:hypothetical protein
MMDRAVARLLFVQPHQSVADTSGRPFETPMLISAVRCTVRYFVLPFLLPLLGVATGATLGVVMGAALGILLLLDGIAAVAIIAMLRRLWRVQHPRRWQYLAVALVLAVMMSFFFVNDTRALFV